MSKKEIDIEALKMRKASIFHWLYYDKIKFPPNQDFDIISRPYQKELLTGFEDLNYERPRETCIKKAAQVGITVLEMLDNIHGLRFGRYPNGVLHLFPSETDMSDLSSTKFMPLIENNPRQIGAFMGSVNKEGARKIGQGFLYFRGARETKKIDGQAGSSSRLKAITVDKLTEDEVDEMDEDMRELARYRLLDSNIKEIRSLSTPTIPNWGIDALYSSSDQRVWMTKCLKCGKYTCLELTFPDCLLETSDGRVIRICMHCKNEIFPNTIGSRWETLYPSKSKDLVGVWISSLSCATRDPKSIIKNLQSNDPIKLKNMYNSDLGMAYLQSEDQLSKNDVYACCGREPAQRSSYVHTAIGVDVKTDSLHVVVGYPTGENRYKVIYTVRVSTWNDLADIARRFNCKNMCIDYEPQTMKAKEFRAAEPYNVYLVDYQDKLKASQKVDDRQGILTVRRTETMDKVFNCVKTPGLLELPRRNEETGVYADELTKTAKILEEDKTTGSRRYVFKKLGADHYYHATNYFLLACSHYELMPEINLKQEGFALTDKEPEYNPFDYIK